MARSGAGQTRWLHTKRFLRGDMGTASVPKAFTEVICWSTAVDKTMDLIGKWESWAVDIDGR